MNYLKDLNFGAFKIFEINGKYFYSIIIVIFCIFWPFTIIKLTKNIFCCSLLGTPIYRVKCTDLLPYSTISIKSFMQRANILIETNDTTYNIGFHLPFEHCFYFMTNRYPYLVYNYFYSKIFIGQVIFFWLIYYSYCNS